MLKRIAFLTAAAVAVLAGIFLALFAWPDPLFPNSVTAGRLSLHSDRPFDKDKARAILADIETRLQSSPLDDHQPHGVYIANAPWLKSVFFFAGSGATGINYYPLTNNVFLGHADVDRDIVYSGATGLPAAPPRTLAYYAAHEITHSFTAEHRGLVKGFNNGMPQWVREGYPDYVATHGHLDLDDLYRRCLAGDQDLNFKKTKNYASFRMLVAYMLERKHETIDQLLETKLSAEQALADLNTGMRPPAGQTCSD